MIFLQMALYCEARPILQHEAFHAMPPVGRFQRWQTEDMMLTRSGTGQAEAATCAAVTCAMHHPTASDLFVVLGTEELHFHKHCKHTGDGSDRIGRFAPDDEGG